MLNDLRTTTPPDAGAAERRAWAVTSAAFAERPRRARLRPGTAVLVGLVAAILALVGVVGFTPPGEAVADFVQRVVDPPPRKPAARPVSVPGPGRMLVASDDGLRIVGRKGAGRSLGRWSGATWSPRALFVGAWSDTELAALSPDGTRHWSVRTPAPVAAARWSPEGFHVAYLLSHPSSAEIRIVAGNGMRDRLWRTGVRLVTPAFRPNARRTLAWVRSDGRIPVADVFTGQVRALSGPRLGRGATAIAWTGDGRRLAVLSGNRLRLWNVERQTVRTITLDGAGQALASSPRGAHLAVLTYDARRGVSTVTLHRHGATVRVRGRLHDLTFAPDGRTLVATWPARRRWLVLGAGGQALQAAPTTRGAPGHITGWCC